MGSVLDLSPGRPQTWVPVGPGARGVCQAGRAEGRRAFVFFVKFLFVDVVVEIVVVVEVGIWDEVS